MGQVSLRAFEDGDTHTRTLSDVYFAKDLTHNLVPYCKLEEKGVELCYKDGRRYLKRASDGARVLAVENENSVLVVSRQSKNLAPKRNEMVYAALLEADTESDAGVPMKCTLSYSHKRLGHLMCDTVEMVADSEGSGIELINRDRPSCVTSSQEKQSINAQLKKDSGANFPIDRIGGVI